MAQQDPDDPLVGQTLGGRYHIEKKLGEGGMGSVYLGLHVALEKRVALKVLHGEFSRKPDLIERFLQEAKAASKIRHENVIDITDFGQTDDGLVYFAMELLDGQDLAEELGQLRLQGERMPWARTRDVFLQICAALSAAHSKGIIHRDLKPENVYLIERLGRTDFVKLLDFGIAKLTDVGDEGRKLTKTGMLFGTPEYMSPEQARGEKVDARVDVYAMGCILFQMVAGHVPFEADNFMGILTLHLTQETPLLGDRITQVGAPPQLEHIVQKSLAKEREDRWASIDEMMQAILTLDDGLGGAMPHHTGVVRAASVSDYQSGAVPVAGAPTPAPQAVNTQWTGSVKMPTVDDNTAGVAAVSDGGSKKGLWLALAAVGALALGGGIFAIAGGGGDDAKPAVVEPETPPEDVPEQPPVDPAAGIPAEVKVTITSEPAGAKIRDSSNGEVIGETPKTFTVPGSDDTITYEVTLAGHTPRDVEVRLDKPEFQRNVTLVKIAGGSSDRNRPRGDRDKPRGDRDKPKGGDTKTDPTPDPGDEPDPGDKPDPGTTDTGTKDGPKGLKGWDDAVNSNKKKPGDQL